MKSRVKRAFTGAKALDIRSPSRVMKTIGKNVGEGFTIGLESTIKPAVAVADSLVAAIKESFSLMSNYRVTQNDFTLSKAVTDANISVIDSIHSLRKEIVLFGNDSRLASFEYEVAIGSLRHASKEYVEEYRKGLLEISRLEENSTAADTKNKEVLDRQNAFKALSDTLLTEDEKRIDLLRTQLALIEAMATATEKSILTSRVLSNTSAVSAYSSIYNPNTETVGQTNLAKIQKSDVESELEYSRQMKILEALERTEAVQKSITDLEANQADKRRQIAMDELEANREIMNERVALTSEGYGMLGNISSALFGEQSKATRAVFAIQKANTLATILLNGKKAISEAWASAPFPQNMGAVATTTLKTASLAVSASGITGQAHAGLDYVPKEGTYLLDEGERVVKPYDNQRLTKFLNKAEGSGSVGATIVTNVNIASNGQTDIQSNDKIGKELGQAINAAIQKQLRVEQRQGGMLAR